MGDLSDHFSRYEFACKDGCGRDTIDAETLRVIEGVRIYFDEPITITSAYRCEKHNKEVGGASGSQHLYGRACDIKVANVHPSIVAEYLRKSYPNKYGIGDYSTFTHIDTRTNGPARWNG